MPDDVNSSLPPKWVLALVLILPLATCVIGFVILGKVL